MGAGRSAASKPISQRGLHFLLWLAHAYRTTPGTGRVRAQIAPGRRGAARFIVKTVSQAPLARRVDHLRFFQNLARSKKRPKGRTVSLTVMISGWPLGTVCGLSDRDPTG